MSSETRWREPPAVRRRAQASVRPYWPSSAKRGPNGSRPSIEMLEMIRTRTSGNLTGQEARFLNHVLTELRLNFVAEADKDKADAAPEPPQEEPKP